MRAITSRWGGLSMHNTEFKAIEKRNTSDIILNSELTYFKLT